MVHSANSDIRSAVTQFVESALASDIAYTQAELTEMVYTKATMLQHAKRLVTGMDHSMSSELKEALDKIKTEDDRSIVIAEIDSLLATADGFNFKQLGSLILLPKILIPVMIVVQSINRLDGSRADYVKALQQLRQQVLIKRL